MIIKEIEPGEKYNIIPEQLEKPFMAHIAPLLDPERFTADDLTYSQRLYCLAKTSEHEDAWYNLYATIADFCFGNMTAAEEREISEGLKKHAHNWRAAQKDLEDLDEDAPDELSPWEQFKAYQETRADLISDIVTAEAEFFAYIADKTPFEDFDPNGENDKSHAFRIGMYILAALLPWYERINPDDGETAEALEELAYKL